MKKSSVRTNNIPVVKRKVYVDLEVTTLDGTKGVYSKFCPSCYSTRSITSFYLRSPDFTKTAPYNVKDPAERICCACRDEQTKRRKNKAKQVASVTLEKFFDE